VIPLYTSKCICIYMDLLFWLLLILIGFLAGAFAGVTGTGGGSFILPALMFIFGFPASLAIGTTLFVVFFTVVSGGYTHMKKKNVDMKTCKWLIIGGLIGVVIGSYIFTLIVNESTMLNLLLGIVFMVPAFKIVYDSIRNPYMNVEGDSIKGANHKKGIIGVANGLLSGVVGTGGGYALVPTLIIAFEAPVYTTMGTTLFSMIPVVGLGALIKLFEGYVDIHIGLILVLGTIVGARLSSERIKNFEPHMLKLIFGLFFLGISMKYLGVF